jgi:hypothetical protein
MARLYLKRTPAGFVPVDDAAVEDARKYKVGEVYAADIKKPRSYQHHKLAFALLSLTYQNQERYLNFDDFRKAVALAAGHSREFVDLNGEIHREVGSLSYDALDEVEFTKVMAAMMTVCAHILHGMDLKELESEVARYADDHYGRSAA